jgi:hypothetical protein
MPCMHEAIWPLDHPLSIEGRRQVEESDKARRAARKRELAEQGRRAILESLFARRSPLIELPIYLWKAGQGLRAGMQLCRVLYRRR